MILRLLYFLGFVLFYYVFTFFVFCNMAHVPYYFLSILFGPARWRTLCWAFSKYIVLVERGGNGFCQVSCWWKPLFNVSGWRCATHSDMWEVAAKWRPRAPLFTEIINMMQVSGQVCMISFGTYQMALGHPILVKNCKNLQELCKELTKPLQADSNAHNYLLDSKKNPTKRAWQHHNPSSYPGQRTWKHGKAFWD